MFLVQVVKLVSRVGRRHVSICLSLHIALIPAIGEVLMDSCNCAFMLLGAVITAVVDRFTRFVRLHAHLYKHAYSLCKECKEYEESHYCL